MLRIALSVALVLFGLGCISTADAGNAGGKPGIAQHSSAGIPPPLTLRDRHERAVQLALENETFQKAVESLVTDAVLRSVHIADAEKADTARKITKTILPEGKKIGGEITGGMSFTDYVTAFADLVETIMTANFPLLSVPLAVTKIAVAYTTAYYYHLLFD